MSIVRRALSVIAALASVLVLLPPAWAAEMRLDPTFGEKGWVLTSIPSNGSLSDLQILDDGSIVTTADGRNGWMVLRHTRHGDPDLTFGFGDGRVNIRGFEEGAAVALLPNARGDLLVFGDLWTTVDGSPATSVAGVRLHSDGSLDRGFAGDGTFGFGDGDTGDNSVNDIALLPHGRIVIVTTLARRSRFSPKVVRLTPDGSRDRSFGTNGVVDLRQLDGARLAPPLVDTEDRLTFIGSRYVETTGWTELLLVRLTDSGDLDPDFGVDGVMSMPLVPGQAARVTPEPFDAGWFVAVEGPFQGSVPSDLYMLKVGLDGGSDPTYGNGTSSVGQIRAGLLFEDAARDRGRLYLVGLLSDGYDLDIAIVKIDPSGDIVPTFGETGPELILDRGFQEYVTEAQVDVRRRLVIGGYGQGEGVLGGPLLGRLRS